MAECVLSWLHLSKIRSLRETRRGSLRLSRRLPLRHLPKRRPARAGPGNTPSPAETASNPPVAMNRRPSNRTSHPIRKLFFDSSQPENALSTLIRNYGDVLRRRNLLAEARRFLSLARSTCRSRRVKVHLNGLAARW